MLQEAQVVMVPEQVKQLESQGSQLDVVGFAMWVPVGQLVLHSLPKRYVVELQERQVMAVVMQVTHGAVQASHCRLKALEKYPERQEGTQRA